MVTVRSGTTKLKRKLRGKLYVPRDRHLQALKNNLTDREFRLLEMYGELSDWDQSHQETYMTFSVKGNNLAPLLGWSESKLSRTRTLLLTKGLIKEIGDGMFILTVANSNPELTEEEIFLGDARMQQSVSKLQDKISPLQEKIASVQANRGYSTQSSLVSFKGDSVSLVPCDRYLMLEKSGWFGAMTADDMEFIEPSNPEWELVRNQILAR